MIRSFSPMQPVRFGLSPQQKASLNNIQANHQPSIEQREYTDRLKRNMNLYGVAGTYVETQPSDKNFLAIEVALVEKLNEAADLFSQNKEDGNYQVEGILETLDSGRLKGQELPKHVQTALENALEKNMKYKAGYYRSR